MPNLIKIFTILFEQLTIFQKNKEENIDKLMKEITDNSNNHAKIEYLFKKIYQINLGVNEIKLLLNDQFIEDKTYLIKTYPKIYTIKSGKLVYTIIGKKSNNIVMKRILKGIGVIGVILSMTSFIYLIVSAFNNNFIDAIALFILLFSCFIFIVYPVEKVLDRIEKAESHMHNLTESSEK